VAPTITVFRWDDDLLGAFLRVDERVYRKDPFWARLPHPDLRAQLSPRNAFFVEGGEHRAFLAFEGPDPVGRVVAMRDGGGTLSTTGLVHEAYLKLVDQSRIAWSDRSHFFALASVAMRHVLVDRARARMAHKREGVLFRVTLDNEQVASDFQPETVLEIDDALDRLAVVEPRLAKIVECRFFGGLSEEETAAALGVTARTVQRDWAKARMLLRRALST
jgi:RNA polymerase sigma factor (TIGR02999 family)